PVRVGRMARVPISLGDIAVEKYSEGISESGVAVVLEALETGNARVDPRTLYDICVRVPGGATHPIFPHSLYYARQWEDFGILHITDLHVSRRNEGYRARLVAAGRVDASREYANFQDGLKDFIRYANHLHEEGLADVVLATGDLIDYVLEEGDAAVNG